MKQGEIYNTYNLNNECLGFMKLVKPASHGLWWCEPFMQKREKKLLVKPVEKILNSSDKVRGFMR